MVNERRFICIDNACTVVTISLAVTCWKYKYAYLDYIGGQQVCSNVVNIKMFGILMS